MNMYNAVSVREGMEIIPIVPKVVRRHPDLAVRGLHVEHHALGACEFGEREAQVHTLYFHTGSPVRAHIRSPEFCGVRWLRRGTTWAMPRGSRHAVRFEGPVAGVAVAF